MKTPLVVLCAAAALMLVSCKSEVEVQGSGDTLGTATDTMSTSTTTTETTATTPVDTTGMSGTTTTGTTTTTPGATTTTPSTGTSTTTGKTTTTTTTTTTPSTTTTTPPKTTPPPTTTTTPPPATTPPPTAGTGGAAAAKTLFASNGCTACHGVSAQGISGGDTGPDLSTVGKTRNAKWIQDFLMKREALNGKKHMKTFKGSEADAQTLATWLAGLK